MTNNLKFASKNFPAKVETYDNGNLVSTEIVLTEDSNDRQWYATTTREIRIIDLSTTDPLVLAEVERRKPKPAADAPSEKPAEG